MSFQLPPNVSFRKEKHGNHWIYHFSHTDMGRIILKPAPNNGETQVVSELIGDPSNPMFEQRAAIFKPLALQLSTAMDQVARSGKPIQKAYSHPVAPISRGKQIARKLIQCERCDRGIGLIILAPDATALGQLEDYARLMYSEMSTHNLPAWIVGGMIPSAGVDHSNEPRCVIRKVYPQREAVFYASPDEFNILTAPLLKKCCES